MWTSRILVISRPSLRKESNVNVAELDSRIAQLIDHFKSCNAGWVNMVNRDHILAALDLIEADDLAYEAEVLQEEGGLDADPEDIQESILNYYASLRDPSTFTESDLLLVWSDDLSMELEDFADHVVSEGVPEAAARKFVEIYNASMSGPA